MDNLDSWFKLPGDRDGQKDIEFLEDRFGALGYYHRDLQRMIHGEFRESVKGLIFACRYFERHASARGRPPAAVGLDSLPASALVAVVLESVARRSGDETYRERFEEWADGYRLALEMYGRLTAENMFLGESSWLRPLVELHDLLVISTMELDEAMCCEHEDDRTPPLEPYGR